MDQFKKYDIMRNAEIYIDIMCTNVKMLYGWHNGFGVSGLVGWHWWDPFRCIC